MTTNQFPLFRLLLFFSIILTGIPLLAQTGGQYLFSHLGTKDGLISNNVLSVQQDPKGYIWLGSSAGLQRYDGKRFISFRHKANTPGTIFDGAVHVLQMDTKGRLWILFGGFRVGYMNTVDLSFHEVPLQVHPDILTRSKGGLFIDNDGNVMVVIVGHGVLIYNEEKKALIQDQQLFYLPPKWNVLYIWQDNLKNYWIGCDSGLVKFNTQRKSLSYRGNNIDNDPVIHAFSDLEKVIFAYVDKTQRFWITSWPITGLKIKSYDAGTGKTLVWQDIIGRSIQGRYYEMYSITELDDGSIWFAGLNLFAKLNTSKTGVEPIPANLPGEYSIRFDGVSRVFEDREKNIWVGTDKGLFRFNPAGQRFKAVALRQYGKDSIYTPDVTDILEMKDGTIVASTWGNGLFSFDKNFNPVKSSIAAQSLKDRSGMVWCLHQRSNGDVWRGDQGGLIFIYHPKTNTTEKIHSPVFGNSTIRQITEDKNGNLWFGTQRGDVIKWDALTNKFSLVHQYETIIPRMIVDKNGDVWVATEVNGVYRINTNNGSIIRHYNSKGSAGKRLRADHITDIVQYNDSMFIIAGNGLNIVNVKNDSIFHVTTDKGLTTNDIFNLLVDKHGYIWMATAFGIESYHPEKRKMSSYIASDGVHTTSFNTGAATLLPNGKIAIGTAHDILVFDPDQITIINYKVPEVQITGVSIMNRSVSVDSLMKQKTVKLHYNQNSIIIDLSTLTFQNTYPIYYMLEGLDKDWIQAGENNQAIYTYLPPGTYTFKTASKDENGKLGPATSIKFQVQAPFWKAWWFYSLLALIAGALFFSFDKQRMQRLKKEQEIRTAIAGNLHQDVSTALQNINVLSEIASIKADKQPEQSKEFIHQIQQKSRNMVIAMNDVLWSIDPKNDSMPKTIERLHEVAHAMQNRHAVTVEVQTDKNVSALNLSMKIRHELIIIYKLALMMLVEELGSKKTIVQFDYDKPLLHLRVLSAGIELPKTDTPASKHILEIKSRAAAINAKVHVQSDGKGTFLMLIIRV